MVFQELDKWMLDIEDKTSPTAKECRLHLKLNRVRNEIYSKYLKEFNTKRSRNQKPAPMVCRERAMPLYLRKTFHIGEESKKAFEVKL